MLLLLFITLIVWSNLINVVVLNDTEEKSSSELSSDGSNPDVVHRGGVPLKVTQQQDQPLKETEEEDKLLKESDEEVSVTPINEETTSSSSKYELAESPIEMITISSITEEATGNPESSGDPESFKFLDEQVSIHWLLGDKYGGLPETITSMTEFCSEIIPRGMAAIALISARWPFKFLLQAVTFITAASYVKKMATWCTPEEMTHFINEAKKVNQANDKLFELREKWSQFILDLIQTENMDYKQKLACCNYWKFKNSCIEAVEAKGGGDFVKSFFEAITKAGALIFCQQYQEDSQECDEQMPALPSYTKRPLYRSWWTHAAQVIIQFT